MVVMIPTDGALWKKWADLNKNTDKFLRCHREGPKRVLGDRASKQEGSVSIRSSGVAARLAVLLSSSPGAGPTTI